MLGAHLAPQPGHMDIDGPAVADMAVPPHRGHQLIAGVHPVRMGDEMAQQLELEIGQVQRPPRDLGGPMVGVDPDELVTRLTRLTRHGRYSLRGGPAASGRCRSAGTSTR
ncbi:hypothetical protein SANT12839_031020 [Streptomyces antimycoticus]|uniref:Uncharacterized protein n=1 Tax=Streptomyces antimycoticus TaxID=68175 RepID=A0A4D4K5C9_9ACTN|nr:hypothetical protein SANT12839_031020 [Streptomyces antimycoticus]